MLRALDFQTDDFPVLLLLLDFDMVDLRRQAIEAVGMGFQVVDDLLSFIPLVRDVLRHAGVHVCDYFVLLQEDGTQSRDLLIHDSVRLAKCRQRVPYSKVFGLELMNFLFNLLVLSLTTIVCESDLLIDDRSRHPQDVVLHLTDNVVLHSLDAGTLTPRCIDLPVLHALRQYGDLFLDALQASFVLSFLQV